MRIKPIYIFDNASSIGIGDIPIDVIVIVKDSDNNGKTIQVLKESNGTLNNNSTVSDFLSNESLYSYIIGEEIDTPEILNTDITNVQNGDILSYDSATNTWVNSKLDGGTF